MREVMVMGERSADGMVAVLAMVTVLLIGLAVGWPEAKASPEWQTVPVLHASTGPVVAR
jgi:hypothetical protein